MTEPDESGTSLDHRRAPMIEHIRDLRARGIVPYLSIGHRLGVAADPEIVALLGRDLFESNTWVSAVEYDVALHEAEALAADAWGADRSFYLVDGSSAGNHALFMAALRPGDEVIVSRDVHWSILVAIIISGATPVYVSPTLDQNHDVGAGVDAEAVRRAFAEHPNARLVVIVSPSWCGVASDLAAIAEVAHAHGAPMYVDEAWGPHFHFHPELPASAMASGADASVTSVHKILPAVSQGSVLHVRGSLIDQERLATSVRMMSTTSPMLPIVATLDAARRQMALGGEQRLDEVIRLSRKARAAIDAIPGYSVLSAARIGLPENRQDLTKFVIDAHHLGISGYDLEHRLNHEFAIGVESADWRGVVANLNQGDTDESAGAFVDALRAIAASVPAAPELLLNARATGTVLGLPEQAMTPREAYFSPSRQVPLCDSAGEIAAELVTPYPPGIPVLAPGEVITAERIAYLEAVYARGAVNYGKRKDAGAASIAIVDRGGALRD